MIAIAPITNDDLFEATRFMREQLNHAIPHETWIAAFSQGWAADKPNNGFMLKDDSQIVGVLGAIYSEQQAGGNRQRFCNLTSLCVLPQYRARTLDLFARCLGQSEYNFTNFTPNPAVEKMSKLLKFRRIEGGDYVLPHVPLPPTANRLSVVPGNRAAQVLPSEIARVYRDHSGLPWLESLIIGRGEQHCLVFYRAARISRLRAAAIVYVSDPELFRRYSRTIGGHLLLRHGLFASRVQRRFFSTAPPLAVGRPDDQARFYRGSALSDADISNLYSELVALPL